MQIAKLENLKLEDIPKYSFDLALVASGYESRSISVAEALSNIPDIKISKKNAWGFTEYNNNPVRLKNNEYLKGIGYEIKDNISGNDSFGANKLMEEYLRAYPRTFNILIDISSMTRNWYGAIIKTLAQEERRGIVRTVFAYSPALWMGRKTQVQSNEVLGPVTGYASHSLPNKPTALIIGLGTDQDRALGLKEHIDPKEAIYFSARNPIEQIYEINVFKSNRSILDTANSKNIITYDIFDAFGTYKILESVCNGFSRDYRIVLASLGPKIFGVFCFLIASYMHELSVWRVSAAAKKKPVDIKASDEKIFFEVLWQ